MQYDVWSETTPGSDAEFYVEENSYSSGSLTLVNSVPSKNGAGWQVTFTAADADETGVNLSITGYKVGDMTGNTITEVLPGVDGTGGANVATSTNFFASVTALSIDAGTAGNVSIGYGGVLALPRTRLKGLYYVAGSNAGEINVVQEGTSKSLLRMVTPANPNVTSSLYMAAEGILTVSPNANNDFATVTLTNVTSATVICG
jgi:hypothetical protein